MAETFAGHESPTRNITPPPLRSPSWFSSLPDDMVWLILAHVPKRRYPILSCVSKNFRDRLLSREIHKIRSLLGKDSVYVCLFDTKSLEKTRIWFTLRRNQDQLASVDQFVPKKLAFPYRSEPDPSVIAIGPEIFFICGSYYIPSSSLLIYDSRTGLLRRGPRMIKKRLEKSVGLVGSKIYVIQGFSEDASHQAEAEAFDLKMQTWKQAPNPEETGGCYWATTAVSLDRKVCALSYDDDVTVCYDTGDGSCDRFELPFDIWWATSVCVIDNVLFVYYATFGLMWYDTKLMLWRVVNGLDHLNKVQAVAVAEYYGKMAFLWMDFGNLAFLRSDHERMAFLGEDYGHLLLGSSETIDIWCRMISLNTSEQGILGIEEAAQLLGSVPRRYRFEHCLSVSD